MRILIATDAWLPQVNGVVTTLRNTVRELEALGHDVRLITPEGFRTVPCPTYPEIRLAVAPGPRVARMIELDPLYVDVAIRRWEQTTGIPARHAELGLTFAEIATRRGVDNTNSCEPHPCQGDHRKET